MHLLVHAVQQFDLSGARANERSTGSEQYPPGMMLALLTHSYAMGVFSSRLIAGVRVRDAPNDKPQLEPTAMHQSGGRIRPRGARGQRVCQ